MPEPRDIHRLATLVMSALMAVLGMVMIVVTLASGGGPFALGLLLGVLFTAAGAGRLYFTWRRP
ncbi:MAG: hypothetical protein QOD69_486 [Solirubrobacteraceae bacterium]|nr:hypothetical protein [Solirubrobacteraceae bacterium]